jgi:hypothetical protein
MDARPERLREFARLMRTDWPEACRQWAGPRTAGASEEDHQREAERIASKFSAATAADYMEWEAAEDISDVLPMISAPALVLAARRFAPRSMGVASLLPNARFEVVDADVESGELDIAGIGRRMTAFFRDEG